MKQAVRTLCSVFVFLLLSAGVARSGVGATVAVVCSDSLTSTQRTIRGARSVIKHSQESVEFVDFLLSTDPTAITEQIESIRASKPNIILTVGSAATQIAKEQFSDIPIVFSSVMYPVISGFVESTARPGQKITGASLDIPVQTQFDKFRQIIPNLKKIGVLYTSNTASLIPHSRVVAAEMGIELIAVEIRTHKDLPQALDSLSREVDGLWSVADPNLFDPQSTKYILLNALRRGLPFMGFSRHVVESGALFALDFDYKAIGRQAGYTINAVLDGADPGRIPVSTPDIIWFHYNEKTAGHVNVQIPPELVAIAKEVYR